MDQRLIQMFTAEDPVELITGLVGVGPPDKPADRNAERIVAIRAALATEAAARAQSEAARATLAAARATAETARWTKWMTIGTFSMVVVTFVSVVAGGGG